METKEAILNLQCSEKMKSGLIIGIGLLGQLGALRGEEKSGALKVLVWYLEGLLRELRISENILGGGYYGDLERKVMELIGRLQLSQVEAAERSFSEGISLATTSCQASMNVLMGKKLV